MLRCLHYEFCKVFSRRLISILWLLLLVLNGVLFAAQQSRLYRQYFENYDFNQAQESRLDAMTEEQRKAELFWMEEYREPLLQIGMMYTWDSSEEMIQAEIESYAQDYPELKTVLARFEDPTKILDILLFMDEYRRQHNWPGEYSEYVRYVQEEAQRMSHSPIFNKKNTFSFNNIQKTAKDFEPCLTIRVGVGNEEFFQAFHSWKIGDLMAIFLILMIAATLFLKEQENGTVYLLRSTPNGRLVTSGAKLVAGFLMVAAVIISFMGENLLLSGLLFGFPEWELPVQSIPVFRECTYLISIREYIVLFFLQKIAAVTMLMAIFAFFVPLFRNSQLVYFFMIVIGALEYSFYILLHPSSYLNILKFLNVFYLFSPVNFFTEYQNLNFFGLALGIAPFIFTFWIVTTVVLLLFYCHFSIHKPEFSIHIKPVCLPVHMERGTVSLIRQEGWRIFFSGKGILVWLLAVFLAVNWYQDFPKPSMNQEDAGYYQYVTQFEGRLTPGKMEAIEQVGEKLDQISEEYTQLAEDFQNHHITKEEYDLAKNELDELLQTKRGFAKFEEQYFDLTILQMRGLNASVLDKPSMDFLFKNKTRDFMMAALMILLLMMTIIPMGRTGENMERLIRSTPKGKIKLFACRAGFSVVFALMMLAGKWLPILLVYLRQYHIADWGAAVQHIRSCMPWEGTMSLGGYLGLWIALQVLATTTYALWFLVLSQTQNRTSVTALSCIMVAFTTMAAMLAEIPGICYINPAQAFVPLTPNLLSCWPFCLIALLAELIGALSFGIYKAKHTQ